MRKREKRTGRSRPQLLLPEKQPPKIYGVLWRMCLYTALLTGGALAWRAPWQEVRLMKLPLVLLGVLLAACAVLRCLRPPKGAVWLRVLPWLALVPLCFLGNPAAGAASWLNSFLLRWNETHRTLIRALDVTASPGAETAFAAVLLVLTGQWCAALLGRKRLWLGAVYALSLLLLSLLGAPEFALAPALLLLGLLGCFLSNRQGDISDRAAFLWAGAAACLLLACLLPGTPLAGVTQFRESTQHQIRDLRYGQEQLPLGDLYRADTLQESRETALSLRSAQEKDLYLKAFTGSAYDGGRWEALPESAYGGENTGMLTWLKNQNFQPQTQLAQYYHLSDSKFSENEVEIRVEHGSRYWFYAPSSLDRVSGRQPGFQRDQDLRAKGLLGQRRERYTEFSGTRPGELSMLEGWVADPVTPEQQQYAQAEAVYREFVYQNYTQVDESLSGLIDFVFRQEEPEGDSVFTVLTHIRDILRQRCVRVDEWDCPEDADPIEYFLTRSRKGNAMLFASTAVEALRSFDIPARYAEGYYCTANRLSSARGDAVDLTGSAAHAWVEVYFDGMGWVAVDVTPGYYYDLVALQQLVSLPEDVSKTAALTQNEDKAGELPGDGTGDNASRQPQRQSWNLRWLLPAVGTAAGILLLMLLTAELVRLGALAILRRRYRRGDALHRAKLTEKILFHVLSGWGIQAGLGWNSEELDALLPWIFPQVKPGEYKRVCALLEKAVYGEIPPEIYEERTIAAFLRKLSVGRPQKGLRYRFLSRYRWVDLV